MVPSISRFQWHPFSVAGGSADGVLTLHVKRYGPFTKVRGQAGWLHHYFERLCPSKAWLVESTELVINSHAYPGHRPCWTAYAGGGPPLCAWLAPLAARPRPTASCYLLQAGRDKKCWCCLAGAWG